MSVLTPGERTVSGLPLLLALGIVLFAQSCAPQRPLRRPMPASTPKAQPPAAPAPPSASAGLEPTKRPLPQDPKIREQDVTRKDNATARTPVLKEAPPAATTETGPSLTPLPPATPPPLADDSSLLAKIEPGTPPQRAASLRLSEEGRKLLESGDYGRALGRLERAIAIDSTNAYGHFLLAKAQYGLKRYQESLNFLDVAESRLRGEPYWLAEVYALRGENFRALGMAERAEASYQKALSINSGNRTAAQALSRKPAESQPAPR